VDELEKACGIMKNRDAYRVLVGKSEGIRLLGKPKLIRKGHIRIDLK